MTVNPEKVLTTIRTNMDVNSKFSEEVILVSPSKLNSVSNTLTSINNSNVFTNNEKLLSDDGSDFWDDDISSFQPYIVKKGILTIPISGLLVNDFKFAINGYLTGYDYIEACFKRGLYDDNVKGIVLKVSSPGGTASGLFDLVDYIYSQRSVKPTVSIVQDSAYSAAYALASAAEKVVVSRTGGVGSVGVITTHVDVSEQLKSRGLKITIIQAGEHKSDGSPYKPLDDAAKKRIQTKVDYIYNVFVGSVSRNRNIDLISVKNTEAQTYMGKEAVSVGFADEVAAYNHTFNKFSTYLNSKGVYMVDTSKSEKTYSEQDFQAAKSCIEAQAVAKERSRIESILNCENAKNSPKLAMKLALTTDLSLDVIESLLKDTSEIQTKVDNPFEKAMSSNNPDVGFGVDSVDKPTLSQTIMSDYKASIGEFKKKGVL